jgi:D-alanyl-D-alanine carboxypeptidase/D-alanyl-D-alanine-endopeptidase (penicillin-binding protein 4)
MHFRNIFILILISLEAFSQDKFQKAFKNFIGSSDLQFAAVTFSLIDIEKNQTLYEHNPELSLPCASTMKAITTGTALAILGENYKFETYLEHDGFIKDETLYGNLYIRGTGDPCLGSPYMEGVSTLDQLALIFAGYLKKKGIKNINGNVVGDGSNFESSTAVPTWQWMDTGNGYGSGVSGINLHDNLYLIGFEQKNLVGSKPEVKQIKPDQPFMTYHNEVLCADRYTGDNCNVYAAPLSTDAWLRGTIPAGYGTFWVQAAVTDPELFAAEWLKKAVQNQGIPVSGKALAARVYYNNESRNLIYTHFSPPLFKIIKHTNDFSRNMYCESMVKAIGKKVRNNGSQWAGVDVIVDFWKKRGIDTRGFFMEDGSGLSMKNAINSKTMAHILRKIQLDSIAFPNFEKLLSISGISGTMKNFGRNTILHGNYHGKGGSMSRVRSYTGYLTTKGKRKVVFSILVNNFNCTGSALSKKVENLLITIAESQD